MKNKNRLASWIMGLLNYEAQYRDFGGINSLIDNCLEHGKGELNGTLNCSDGDFVFKMELKQKGLKGDGLVRLQDVVDKDEAKT